MVTPAIQVVHSLPGRVRVRLSMLKGNPSLAGEVERTLTAIQGIEYVETSTTTGSVLILYEPYLLAFLDREAVDALLKLAATLGLPCEEVDSTALQHWLNTTTDGTRSGMSATLGSNIAAMYSNMSAGAIQASGGWGALRTLVPLTLAFLGLRSLLLTQQLPFPTWYDYLWFAFSTYMVLNSPSRPMEKSDVL